MRHICLKLLSFIIPTMVSKSTNCKNVRVANLTHLGFRLPLEECIVQFLVIKIQSAHLWLPTFARLVLQPTRVFAFIANCSSSLTHLHNSSCFNVIGQIKRRFQDATLILEVLFLLRPMPRNWNRVSVSFEVCQCQWICSRNINPLPKS